jgi:hypothetical protein
MPVIGGKYFTFDNGSIKRQPQYREGIEYKKGAFTTFIMTKKRY